MSKGKGIPTGMQDMLNLPHLSDILAASGVLEEQTSENIEEENEDDILDSGSSLALSVVEVFENNLKTVGGEDHAKHLDVIADETLDHAKTVMDLAFNVDDRSRRGMIEQAANLYKTSIDAKNSKRDYEIKLLKLLQDQRKLEFDERKWRESRGEQSVESSSEILTDRPVMADRNELIKKAIAEKSEGKD